MASYIPHVKYAKGKVRLTNHWIKHILFSYLDKYTFNNDLQVQGLSMELVGSMGLPAEMRWCRRELAPGSAHGSLPFLSLPAPGSILYYTSHGSKFVMAQPTWNALCVCKPRQGGQPLAWNWNHIMDPICQQEQIQERGPLRTLIWLRYIR